MSFAEAAVDLDITVQRLKKKYLDRGRERTANTSGVSFKSGSVSTSCDVSPEPRMLTSVEKKSPESGLSYSERRQYRRAIRELYETVSRGSDRQDRTEQCMFNGSSAVSEEELSGEEAVDALDTNSQLYTETDVTLPSNLARASGSHVTDPHADLRAACPRAETREKRCSLPPEMGQVYREMLLIYDKLQVESVAQRELAAQLREREHRLQQDQARLLQQQSALGQIRGVEEEVRTTIRCLQEQHQQEVRRLQESLRDRDKENKRLTSSFETMKAFNDTVKKQLHDVSEQNKRLEKQARSVQARLENLQRKHELLAVQRGRENIPPGGQDVKRARRDQAAAGARPAKPPPSPAVYEALAALLDWVVDLQLRHLPPRDGGDDSLAQERCSKLLPMLTEQLQSGPAVSASLHVPLVRFIYWALRQLENTPQHNTLTSTMRRLGEEAYRGAAPRRGRGGSPDRGHEGKPATAAFFRSPSLHVRFLSTLIVLKTVSQADRLAQALDSLHRDLQAAEGRALFLQYQALPLVLALLHSGGRGLLSAALDILLQMTADPGFLDAFLQSCSSESCFRTLSLLLRQPRLDVPLLEKISVLLQKLSKIKRNKRLFELSGIHLAVQEMHRTADPAHTFLTINLNSILYNLGLLKRESRPLRFAGPAFKVIRV
ncbi:coiled-coil domain-containing protein 138 isoform X2 [Amia ocellicauda]|uniref:coiled-coil domain-containing protein 138 isoform X2 n=1 Tax=Amia ocellicauda TaxID=2972642 RepID=UPI003464AADD